MLFIIFSVCSFLFGARQGDIVFQIVKQGWRSVENACLPPICPGFDSRTRRHMWVEFVVDSLLCSGRFFSGSFGFPSPQKTNISKFQFDPGIHGDFGTSSCELLGAPWVTNYIFTITYIFYIFT